MRAAWFAILLVGCGANSMMAPSPLIGAWKGNVTGGTLTFIFRSNATYEQHLESMDTTTGCSSTLKMSGTWTSAATTFSTVATAGHYTATGCIDTAMNLDRAANAQEIAAYSLTDVSFDVTGDMLTAALGGMAVTFTRSPTIPSPAP